MKKNLQIGLLGVLGLVFASGCGLFANVVKGNGLTTTEIRSVPHYDQLDVKGSIDVEVSVGRAPSLQVIADANLLQFIRTEVRDGVLLVSYEPNVSIITTGPILVKTTTTQFRDASLNGSGNIAVTGLQNAATHFDINGSGDIQASGTTSDLFVDINGSGDFESNDLAADSAIININGSGDVKVHAQKSLEVEINGSGDVFYSGSPVVSQDVRGSGDILKQEF